MSAEQGQLSVQVNRSRFCPTMKLATILIVSLLCVTGAAAKVGCTMQHSVGKVLLLLCCAALFGFA